MSTVTLVGAGPGDLDLLTIKGMNAIKEADVILYDALVNEEMLKYAKQGVKCIYVGKKFGNHKYSQFEINDLLLECSLYYNKVVRLKGGDSFVFGRGAEEMTFLEESGLEVKVIPGITSAIAVPELQGIPLTKRKISESFMVVTGVNSSGKISNDLIYGAKSNTTLVILMGLRKLSEIMDLVSLYRSSNTPFAIIQNGSLFNERFYINKIGNYNKVKKELDCEFPGVIVIGDVVAEHPQFLSEEIHRVLERFS
ncbi:uroporphyrinogen-III C-methyltransferase [Urechidicola vernalis]|uniref:uroporphyrinogen-III C-methyltransferase n=1 Tax=Urechidicola vernalis TaxID=3075600 RepID=A0ABU2Y544_9FLAO|nr:uroporphyrinogen-III C-methyltransferase [Urechidicola sp. P050]MDT0553311.1 uroporphyrinogen-III C-methyltransferase [Urechidicola sp. P050]